MIRDFSEKGTLERPSGVPTLERGNDQTILRTRFKKEYFMGKFTYNLTICFISFVVSSCAPHPKFNITSSVPSYIEIDGEIVCRSTPCEIIPPHYVRGFGECADGSSMNITITAFPLDKSEGTVQQKNVTSTCGGNKNIFFDMEASRGIRLVPFKN